MNCSLMWFRYDLRLDDNEAFYMASKSKECIPIFILDTGFLNLNTTSDFHLNFLKESLNQLSLNLKNYNTNLFFYKGETIKVLKMLIEKHSIKKIFSNRIFKNIFYKNLDINIQEFLKSINVDWVQTNQFGIQLDNRVRGMWSKNWNDFISKPLSKNPLKTNFIRTEYNSLSNFLKTSKNEIQVGGENIALSLLNSFLNKRHINYSKKMSSPLTAEESCSRLSPHIAFGTISIKRIITNLNRVLQGSTAIDKRSLYAFKKRLAWHCHFIQKLYDEPKIEFSNLHPSYNGLRENEFNEEYFNRWKDGLTGFPFLDACMRYLNNKGWLNFRMRAMVVSFASYQLWLDWRVTSKYLARVFTDYEPGIHYSQIQMQSGTTGINSIRIYNVVKQSYDQDPKGVFIKKWVPELEKLPTYLVHEPWRINYLEENEYNFFLEKNYMKPIVDNQKKTKEAKDKIWKIKRSPESKKISINIVNRHASLNFKN